MSSGGSSSSVRGGAGDDDDGGDEGWDEVREGSGRRGHRAPPVMSGTMMICSLSNFSMSDRTQVGEAVPSPRVGGVRTPRGSAGRGLHGGGGGRGLSGARGRGLDAPACCWRCGGFGGTCGLGPGSGGRLLLGGVTVVAGSSGGPVSLTCSTSSAGLRFSVSSAPPSREAGPEQEELGPGSEVD